MTMRRYLDPIEEMFVNVPLVTFPVAYRGTIDEPRLARAFSRLATRHPILRGRISNDQHGNLLQVRPDYGSEFAVLDGDLASLLAEIKKPWNTAQAVSQLLLVRNQAQGYLALRLSHSIADGGAYFYLLDELWQGYADLARPGELAIEPGAGLPISPYTLFERYRPRAISETFGIADSDTALSDTALSGTALSGTAPIELDDPIHRRLSLSQPETQQLISAARANATTVYALIGGALALAHARYDGMAPRAGTVMRIRSDINLRNHVSPRVAPYAVTNFSAPHFASIRLDTTTDPVKLGQAMRDQLTSSLTDLQSAIVTGEILVPGFSSINSADLLHTVTDVAFCVNNLGVIPRLAQVDGLVITDLLELPYWRIEPWSSGIHRMHTFHDRLSVASFYPGSRFGEDEATRLRDILAVQLSSIIGSPIAAS